MTIVFSVLMVAACAFLALWAYSAIAAFQTRKLHSYEEWSDRFFNLSARLIDHDNLPPQWLETISSLNEWIDDPKLALGVARAYERSARQDAGREVKGADSELAPEELAFLERNPNLARDYVAATRSAFLALTFLGPLTSGERARALMAEQWERKRGRSAIEDIETVRKASHLKLVHSAV